MGYDLCVEECKVVMLLFYCVDGLILCEIMYIFKIINMIKQLGIFVVEVMEIFDVLMDMVVGMDYCQVFYEMVSEMIKWGCCYVIYFVV